jgi:para-nitrobenzyl esterase
MFACNAYSQATTFAGASMNTFQYWFRDEDAPWTLVPPLAVTFPLGATHAGEIPYVLYAQSLMEQRYTGDLNDLSSLSGEMVDYWTQFAKDGNPSTTDGVAAAWPQAATGNLLMLDVPNASSVSTLSFLGYHHCGYWANPPLLVP